MGKWPMEDKVTKTCVTNPNFLTFLNVLVYIHTLGASVLVMTYLFLLDEARLDRTRLD